MNKFRKPIFLSSIFFMTILFFGGTYFLSFIISNKSNPKSSGGILEKFIDTSSYTTKPFNILLLGGDVNAGSTKPADINLGNTDTIMILNYNPDTSQISILSIPRDTRITLNGSHAKINSVYATNSKGKDGAKAMSNTISNLLGIKIDHYAFISTSSFRSVIDILGGVDYNIPCDIKYTDKEQDLNIDFKKGMQHLDGKKAEEFMRFRGDQDTNKYKTDPEYRKYYDGGDLKRIDAQQSFIKEFIRQKATITNITKINSICKEILSKLDTTIDLKTILAVASDPDSLKIDKIKMFKIGVVDWTQDLGQGNNVSYVIFTNKITDNSSNVSYPSNEIINQYFLGVDQSIKKDDSNNVPIESQIPVNTKVSVAYVPPSVKPTNTPKPSIKPSIKPSKVSPTPSQIESPPIESPTVTHTRKN